MSFSRRDPIHAKDYVKSAYLFSKVPITLIRKNICVVYYGAIAEWTDISILKQVVDEPNVLLIMAGPIVDSCEDEIERLKRRRNCFHLGTLRYEELSSLLRYADIGIAPFVISRMTDAVLPLKVLEYLAAGLPVIVSDLAAIREFDDTLGGVSGLHVYKSAADIPKLLRKLASPVDKPVLTEIQVEQTGWMRSVQALREYVNLPLISISDWSFNSNPADGVFIRRRDEVSIILEADLASLDRTEANIFIHNEGVRHLELRVDASGAGVIYGGDLMLSSVTTGEFFWVSRGVVKDPIQMVVPGDAQVIRIALDRRYQRAEGILRLCFSVGESRGVVDETQR